MKFAFIAEQSVAFTIATLCRVLAVSTSGYYAWAKRPASPRVRRDGKLAAQIRSAHGASKGRYCSKTCTAFEEARLPMEARRLAGAYAFLCNGSERPGLVAQVPFE